MKSDSNDKIGFWETAAIGVGGMVGGGIFAVLGMSVELARGGSPVAFGIAGIVALLTAYSYSRLSITFPGQGGTVTYLNHALGSGIFTGGLNILLWISYIVMLSLYAYAFGSYAAAFVPTQLQPVFRHVFISAVVLLITGLNVLSARAIGRAEIWIVAAKLLILLLFGIFGLLTVEWTRIGPAEWSSPINLLAGGMVIFLAYEGFELIANSAHDVRNPRRILPLSFFSSVIFVMVLYILVSGVAAGNLSVDTIVQAKDYALAEAARPFMGSTGFILIGIAAMLSTASAINATFYGAARLSYTIAKDGELPKKLERKIWNRPLEGLLITSVVTLLVANVFDLSNISTMGSAGFLIIFAAVNVSNAILRTKTESRGWLSLVGAAACIGALGTLIWHTFVNNPEGIWVLIGMVALSFGIEAAYRSISRRSILVKHHPRVQDVDRL